MPDQKRFGSSFLCGVAMIGLLICADANGQEPVKSENEATLSKGSQFAIYLVTHPPSEPDDPLAAERASLTDLVLDEMPILTEDEIDSYRISPEGRHFIKLKSGVRVRLLPIPGGVILDQGFVVVADGMRIYLGDFNSLISSHWPGVPVVGIPLARPGATVELGTDIEICRIPIREPLPNDPRADPRIIKVLQDIDKLDSKQDPEGWGESFQSIRVRLIADRPTWKHGDAPSFMFEILNGGSHELKIPTGPNACRGLEIDGTWFESAAVPYSSLGPGSHYQTIIILKPENWRSQGKLLDLKPGKHAIRAFYDAVESQYGPLRLVSNLAEIQILPVDAKR